MAKGRRGFGSVVKEGKVWAAFYRDPLGRTRLSRSGNETPVRCYAPNRFQTKQDAEAWLVDEHRLISSGAWTPPDERRRARAAEADKATPTLDEYAATWLRTRRSSKGRPLAPATVKKYRGLLSNHLGPLGDRDLTTITRTDVREWYEAMGTKNIPTTRAHAYNLLHDLLESAYSEDELVAANPVKIRGAGQRHRAKKVVPATQDELATIVEEMPERHRLLVLLATWSTLRSGELRELRRPDLEFDEDDTGAEQGLLHVRRGVIDAAESEIPDLLESGWQICPCRKRCLVGPPKTDAGERDLAIPSFLLPAVHEHLRDHAASGPNGLLFPAAREDENTPDGGKHLAHGSFYGRATTFKGDGTVLRAGWGWLEARRVAGREDLDFHDLRHTGASLAGQQGASIAELMHRLGHTTPAMAMLYQHSTRDRDREIARRLSKAAVASR